jgi:DNA polymerase-3 subunit beta
MDICKALPEGEKLSIIEEQDRVTLRAGRSRFTLSTLPASDFPNVSEQVGTFKFTIPKKELRSLIEQTSFAMAEQDVRYYLNGMLLEVKHGHVYGVAADGHRLAFGKIVLDSKEAESIRVIVPRKGVLELQRMLDDSNDEITIILGDNHIRAVTAEGQLTSKLLDGRFPDYERLILIEGDKIVTGKRDVLKEGFQRAAALFSDRFRGVRLRLMEGCLKISATNAEQDEVEEDIEVDYTGNELEIGFNIKYLIDFLNAIQTETVKFTFSNPNSSARVEGIGAESGVYVIMPMRI